MLNIAANLKAQQISIETPATFFRRDFPNSSNLKFSLSRSHRFRDSPGRIHRNAPGLQVLSKGDRNAVHEEGRNAAADVR